MTKKRLIITIILVIVMGGAGAFAWKMIPAAQEATGSLAKFLPQGPKPTAQPLLLRNNMKPFMGPIISKEEGKLVIKNPDGKDSTVLLADSTKISGGKEVNLLAGTKISGLGKVAQDGTITAQVIQINPQSPLNKQ